MQLPDDLREALESELGSSSGRALGAASRDLSQRYRGRPASGVSLLQTSLDPAAYAAYRMPATFAALAAAMAETRARLPDWSPRSLLDVGAGPGTAAWAAVDVWPSLESVTSIERDPAMIALGRRLAAHGSTVLQGAQWIERSIADERWDAPSADLTAAGYVLGELTATDRAAFVEHLWKQTMDVCLIAEPGTPRGYGAIRQATETLAGSGAQIIAPFPASWQCLEHDDDWCHFSVRAPRTRLQRAAKGATLSYEDEKYSYVVASRLEAQPIAGRIIRHPQTRSGMVSLTICTASGIRKITITRSNKAAFRLARDLKWGDAIEMEEAEMLGL